MTSMMELGLDEADHVVTAATLEFRVKRIGISWHGPYIVGEAGKVNICIARWATNKTILTTLLWSAALVFARTNLALGLSNLLSIQGRMACVSGSCAPVENLG